MCVWHLFQPLAAYTPRTSRGTCCAVQLILHATANPRTNIMDFRWFDSSIILILRGGIRRPIGNFLESLSQAMLVGVMLVGRLGACFILVETCFWPTLVSSVLHKDACGAMGFCYDSSYLALSDDRAYPHWLSPPPGKEVVLMFRIKHVLFTSGRFRASAVIISGPNRSFQGGVVVMH